MTQPTLFEGGAYRPPLRQPTREDQLYAAFLEFDRENPWAWDAFERMALALIADGARRISAKSIYEVMRMQGLGSYDSGYKLNNNFTTFFAQRFEFQHPEHVGVFERRARVSKFRRAR